MIRHDHQDPCFGGAFRVFLGLPSYVLLLVVGKNEDDVRLLGRAGRYGEHEKRK